MCGLSRDSVVLLEQIRTIDKKRLKDKIIKEFDVGEESIDVKAEFVSENDRYRVSTVWLTIRKGAVSTDPRKLVEYVENLLDCQCVIVYE